MGGGVWLGENTIGVSSSVVSDLGKSSVAEGVWEWALAPLLEAEARIE